MSLGVWLGVAVAGAIGALARVGVDTALTPRLAAGGGTPAATAATAVVNLTGAALLGFVDGLALAPHLSLLLGTALLGAYTTFSTWMLQLDSLRADTLLRLAGLAALGPLLAGFGAVALGHVVGAAF